MIEWLFFLLPIAALSGWLMARKYYKNKYRPSDSLVSPEYFKGLNYLLNEQPDKAIDVFIRLLEVNSETVETHLALANLFRRRGESDRAIRIHQNLIARPTLNPAQRTQALVELGLDYMNAGVLDRAEQLFLEILQQPSPPPEAAKQLLRIYQQEKNWLKAIEMAKKCQPDEQTNVDALISQFYCELAQQQINRDPAAVLSLLKQAQSHDRNCVRGTLLEANIYISTGHYQKALKALLKVEHQNHHYLPEALDDLFNCYQKTQGLDTFKTWLQQLLERHPNMTSARLMLTHVIQQQQGNQAAQDYLYQKLHKYPSVEGLDTLINLGQESNPELIPLLKNITKTLLLRGDRYTCKNCGFSGKTLHWQCPGCGQWASVRPTEIHLSTLEKLLEPS
ncbi:MAG: lipopolysaccharide assembly protein LapB [Methylophaga sp.]|nr:MAG: lipopolysaccharide assembly protein LapB [Methylophaga sp.]